MNDTLKKALTGNLDEYKSIPFWSWNNTLDENVLVKQIEDMKRAEIGGFIMHARTGLKDEYLGEKWFSCIAACLKKAKELGMKAWVYDENGWPSGFVGGKLLENENFRARFLELKQGEFDKTAHAVYVKDDEKGFVRVSEPLAKISEYYNVYIRISPANTDILNPEVVDAFIAETHEKYYERFKDSFGHELEGFFTDEPQYYRYATPYTPVADTEFKKHGENLDDGLIWLFMHDERGYAFREKYYATLNKLYVTNFYKKLHDWCNAHGCRLTGHSVEENSLFTQMWGGGAVMTSYEHEDIPAIDCLGRFCVGELPSKQVGSVAAQLGKKRVLTETFGCAGNDVTPKELVSVAESQYFNGVNMMCQHLYPYSMASDGKIDHPPVFGPHGNWVEGFKTFNEHFNKLGCIIANTEEIADVAVIHPQHDVWLDYIRSEDLDSVRRTEEDFAELLSELRKNGVLYQLVDETLLSEIGETGGDKFKVGKRLYKTVIVPKMRNLAASTYEILKKYNGDLCVLSVPEYIDGVKADIELKSTITLEEIINQAPVYFRAPDGKASLTVRKGQLGEFIFVKNFSYFEDTTVTFKNVAEHYRKLNLETLTESDITNDVVIPKSESLILVKSDDASISKCRYSSVNVTDSFKVASVSDNYLVMDRATISKDGVEYSDNRPIPGLFEDLLREDYKGKLYVRQTFVLNEKMPLSLVMERADLNYAKLNGVDLEFFDDDFDVNFVIADAGKAAIKGENVFEYCLDFWQHEGVRFALFDPMATESVKNCLYFDTSIQTTYLKGEFIVNKDFSLSNKTSLPPLTDRLCDNGYPFFKGELTLKGKVTVTDDEKKILDLEGRFMMATVKANGKSVELTLDNKGDITDVLKRGENDVEIVLRSSLRNLFGPHHFRPEPEPMGVGPYVFTFRGFWKDGKEPEAFTPEYNFVPFGVNNIELITEKN